MEPQVGDLVKYWIEPTIIKYRRRLQGKVGIVIRIAQQDNDPVCYVDFIDAEEDWVNLSDLIVLSRPTEIKADLPAAKSDLDKCPK